MDQIKQICLSDVISKNKTVLLMKQFFEQETFPLKIYETNKTVNQILLNKKQIQNILTTVYR